MRLAHCSDVHLLSLTGARWLDFANKRWIGGLNLLSNRSRHYSDAAFDAMIDDFDAAGVDHVVCTGDITNVALESEFVFARGKFDRIALGPDHVTVIPGNHDAYIRKGAEHFAAHFGAFHRPDEGWAWDDGDPWPVVRVRGPLAIIGVSTSLQTPWFTAWGRIGAKQLARLEQVLGDARLQGLLRMVAIHHPPAGPRAHSRVRGLRDWRAFGDVIGRTGTELVIHGHEHRDMVETLIGPDGALIEARGVQSGTYIGAGKPDRRARYRIYEIDTAAESPAIRRHRLRVYDAASGRFCDDPDPPAAPLAAAPDIVSI